MLRTGTAKQGVAVRRFETGTRFRRGTGLVVLGMAVVVLQGALTGASSAWASGTLSVSKQLFGSTVEPYTGKVTSVYEYTLTNTNGMSVQILTYGAIVRAIDVPDRTGQPSDVALGFNSLQDYVTNDSPPVTTGNAPYFGEVLGRYANRLAGGTFTLSQPGVGPVTYAVPVNSDGGSLNGGLIGFGAHIWSGDQAVQGPGYVGVQMTLVSPNGDQAAAAGTPGCPNGCTGYPGELQVVVTYTLNDQNQLSVSYAAKNESSNLNTVVNLTNASYFNLAGENAAAGSAYGQQVEINGDNYTPINTSQIPLGQEASVIGTPLDFTTPQTIGSRIDDLGASFNSPGYNELSIAEGYDFNWALNAQTQSTTGPGGLNLAARAIDSSSGRELSVFTNQPGVQFDTANLLNGTLSGISGGTYRQGAGYAFETQHFPDSPNESSFPSTVLDAGQSTTATTVYQFSAAATNVAAPASGTAGTAIAASSISSALSDVTSDAGGTVTYTVFGPQSSPPSDCSSGGTAVGVATVSGSGTYQPSAGYTPTTAGTYYWYASYSGDAGNQPANSGCGSGMGSTVVAPAVAPAASIAALVPASLSKVSISPSKASIAGRKVRGKCAKPTRKSASAKHCDLPVKLSVGYTLNAATTITFTVHGSAPGRKVGAKCVAQTSSNEHKKRCIRPLRGGSFTETANAGTDRLIWNGKLAGRELAPGTYTITATIPGGAPETVGFTVAG
jgi:aldose 1-epimerase